MKTTRPTDTDGIIGRIRHLMDIRRLSQAGLAKLVGIDASNVSKYLSGRLPLSDSFLNRVIINLNVSKPWLYDGTGLPLDKGYHTRQGTPHMDSGACVPHGAIPVYDIDVAAGITEMSREYTRENVKGYIMLPDFNPNWVAVRAQGDSMAPLIDNGAFVVFLPENDLGNIVWGQIYVVVMENRRVVKFVRRHQNPEYLILKSKNEEYDSMDVRISDIHALYPVKAIVNIKMQL